MSNVPFGQVYHLGQDSRSWFTTVLTEAARVVMPGGRVVVLSSGLPARAVPEGFTSEGRNRIRILGMPAVIDTFVNA